VFYPRARRDGTLQTLSRRWVGQETHNRVGTNAVYSKSVVFDVWAPSLCSIGLSCVAIGASSHVERVVVEKFAWYVASVNLRSYNRASSVTTPRY
jgi:hypothetical protein